MQFLVLVSCVLAVSSAGWIPHHHEEHHPIIGPHGVPLDTPEVQHARAEHLAAHAVESAKHAGSHYEEPQHNSYDDGGEYQHYQPEPVEHEYHHHAPATSHVSYVNHVSHEVPYHHEAQEYHQVSHQPHAYQTHHGEPIVTHDGKPLDTPEVEEAKAHHFAAVHEALARVSHHGSVSHYRKRRNVYPYHHHSAPLIGHDGRPIETPEVQHAKALHLAAHAKASAGQHSEGTSGHYAHHITHVYSPKAHYDHGEIPAIGHDGKPLDTYEVAHAKAAHFAAYHEAAAKNSIAPYHYGGEQSYGHNGAPEDTHEVQIAKAKHFAAHAAAKASHY